MKKYKIMTSPEAQKLGYPIPDGVKVVSQKKAEKANFLVCVRKGTPTPFSDNREGTCSKCGHTVIFRPTAPEKPTRICFECVMTVVS